MSPDSQYFTVRTTAVNLIVGLLYIKELTEWTDEELIGSLYFDYGVQYALGITDFEDGAYSQLSPSVISVSALLSTLKKPV